MNFLLDTHVFLWYVSASARLSMKWRVAIQNPDNQIFLSVVSVWEASIKYRLGKLPLPEAPEVYLPRERERHKIASLALEESSILSLVKLPSLHRDPFDRKLISQALELDLTLMTVDQNILAYPVKSMPIA